MSVISFVGTLFGVLNHLSSLLYATRLLSVPVTSR